jgi:hypothetical protein
MAAIEADSWGVSIYTPFAREMEKPLANQPRDSHVWSIEFRPNDLASPLIARLTDDPLPQNSN